MNASANDAHGWITASSDHTPDTSPAELSALEDHLDACKASRGRMFALARAADAMHSFVAGRFVTTLILVALLIALIAAASLAF